MIINAGEARGGGSTPTLQTKSKTYTPTTSQQTEQITADVGYDGLQEVDITVNAISPTQAAQTIYPSSSDQTISSGRYLTGTQTFKAVTTTNLTAANIKSGVTVEVGDADDPDRIMSILGTYAGGGSGVGTLLATQSLGTISTSSTTATDTGQRITINNINNYDLLIYIASVTAKGNKHLATCQAIWLSGSNNAETKNGFSIATATLNFRQATGVPRSGVSTTKYGIYVNSANVSGGSITLNIYQRYNNTQTTTINSTYTARVYGVKLYEIIGT